MRRYLTRTALAVAALILGLFTATATARAQYIQVYSPPVVVAPPVVSYYTPVVSYPVTTYYAPPVTTSYYTPAVTYSYYPPTTVYSAPAAVVPGAYTTRSFVGYGVFRPRGVYTQSYYTPGAVFVR